jgi:TfoX/Sxy family transcriptional regulator of competence genes
MTPGLLFDYIFMGSIGLLFTSIVAGIVYAGFYFLRLHLIAATEPTQQEIEEAK